MSGWFAFPADAWPEAREALVARRARWGYDCVVADLRWYVDQRERLPGVRDLAARWRWSRSEVEAIIGAVDTWRDTATPGGQRPLLRTGQVYAALAKKSSTPTLGRNREATGKRPGSDREATQRVDAEYSPETGSDREATGKRPGSQRARLQDPPDHPSTRSASPPKSPSRGEGDFQPESNEKALAVATIVVEHLLGVQPGAVDKDVKACFEAPAYVVTNAIKSWRARLPEGIKRREVAAGLRLGVEKYKKIVADMSVGMGEA